MNRTLALIPHYRHPDTLPVVVAALRAYGLPVMVVDDGSGADCLSALESLRSEGVQLVLRSVNGGKGSAVKWGMRLAAEQGYTHVLQIDADAQHCFDDIPKLLAASNAQPQAVVCGRPVYGSDAPKSRLYGRKITDFWNVLHTWSFAIKDGMCGFRIYPLNDALAVVYAQTVGERMDFDNELLVRLYWRGSPLVWVDTPVRYRPGGVSHFQVWRDNLMISKMHARLFFGMLTQRFGCRR